MCFLKENSYFLRFFMFYTLQMSEIDTQKTRHQSIDLQGSVYIYMHQWICKHSMSFPTLSSWVVGLNSPVVSPYTYVHVFILHFIYDLYLLTSY